MSAWRVDDDLGVLAAVGNVARMTRPEGFSASSDDPVMIGQIHLCEVPDLAAAQKTLEANFAKLTKMAEDIQPRLIARGGGLRCDGRWKPRGLVGAFYFVLSGP